MLATFADLMDAESVVFVDVTVDLPGRYFVGVREEARGGQHCQQEGELGCRLHCDSESTEMMMNGEDGVDKEHTCKQDRTEERCPDVTCLPSA